MNNANKNSQSNVSTSGEGSRLELYVNQEWKSVEVNGKSLTLPSDWGAISLDDAEQGGLVSLGRGMVISKKDLASHPGGFPVYSSSAVGDGKFGEYSKYMFEEEMVTWSIDGGGHFFYRPFHKYSVTNVCGWMKTTSELVSTRFVYLCLHRQHKDLVFDYQNKAHPSVIRRVYHLLTPPTREQTLIAQALSTQEAQVADLRKLAAIERQRLTWLSDELLSGRLRVVEDPTAEPVVVSRDDKGEPVEVLPGVRLVESEELQLTTINGRGTRKPADWKVLPIGDLADVVTGSTPSKRDADFWVGGSVNWFSTPDFKKKKGGKVQSSAIKLTEVGAKKSRVCPAGTVMVSCIATVGEVAVLGVEGAFNQQINGILPNDKFVSDYLRHYLEHIAWRIKSLASESVIKIINKTNFERVEIVLPAIKEQSLIAAILTAQETQVADIEHLADLEQKRLEWLSDELLSGRLRIKVPA